MKNFNKFILSTTLFDFALGFFGPFWFLFLSDFGGGIEQFGMAVALMTIASACTSFLTGKMSDVYGRKSILIFSTLSLSVLVLCYVFVSSLIELYILQILYGILMAIQNTGEVAFLGDLTEGDERGAHVGRIHFFAQIASAFAILIASYIGANFGLKFVFITTSVFMVLSALALSTISEER